ncbi:hypothetical protein [Cyanothece sp. BG0011]|uniref:hypothetical protein n=1 Tax=Cyanothece sp. BG0011 TaxID=2082950 RepID=UPI000D1FAE2A|nr:hypothetical protein [Cyanothece sp. BG0011]
MAKKSFCILEQGKIVNEPCTIEKRKMFTTEFSDFYRLNWNTPDDPNAFIHEKGVTWSEGRSLLYEKVPKDYDYYIFIDDDVLFQADEGVDIPKKIKELLEEYNPIAGTFYDHKSWCFIPLNATDEELNRRKSFPIAGYDAESQIVSKSFADIMFPAIYHGAHRTDWYLQWVCHQTFPLKQMAFYDIRLLNLRSGGHSKFTKPQHCEPTEATFLFNRHVKDKSSILKTKNDVIQNNIDIFKETVDKTPINFTIEDLKKVYNINNIDFKIRKPLASRSYLYRRPWNRFWWKVTRKLTGEYRY